MYAPVRMTEDYKQQQKDNRMYKSDKFIPNETITILFYLLMILDFKNWTFVPSASKSPIQNIHAESKLIYLILDFNEFGLFGFGFPGLDFLSCNHKM